MENLLGELQRLSDRAIKVKREAEAVNKHEIVKWATDVMAKAEVFIGEIYNTPPEDSAPEGSMRAAMNARRRYLDKSDN